MASASYAPVNIFMLGGFRLRCGDVDVQEDRNHAQKPWRLLAYLIAFRARSISVEELIDYLWPDGASDNPQNALKNLVYRLRTVLTKAGFPSARDLIVYRKGVYAWNPEIPTVVDAEEMEFLLQKAAGPRLSEEESLALYLDALALYKGDLLPSASHETRIVPLVTYYRSLYLRAFHKTAALLSARNRWDQVEKICRQAAQVDFFDEETHLFLMRALLESGQPRQALKHYEHISESFYRELGMLPSETLRDYHQNILKNLDSLDIHLQADQENFMVPFSESGAFICDYDIFQHLCRLEARSLSRTGRSVFLMQLALTDPQEEALPGELLEPAMQALLGCLSRCLRRSDVVSRCGDAKYILMLAAQNCENGLLIFKRIRHSFTKESPSLSARLHFTIQPLQPAD